jgi:hypothetical protein
VASVTGNNANCGQFKLTGSNALNVSGPISGHSTTGISSPSTDANGSWLWKNMLFWQSASCIQDFGSPAAVPRGAFPASFTCREAQHPGWRVTGGVQMIVGTFEYSGGSDVSIAYNRFIETPRTKVSLLE